MLVKIPNYDNYLINESGNIVDNRYNLQRTAVDQNGLIYVYLGMKKEYVHELVARTFLNNIYNLPFVIHINGDKLNNHITNLKYSEKSEIEELEHNSAGYSVGVNIYEVFNDETGDCVTCYGREQVADTIQYSLISLKNMIGNDRKIFLGPYKGYKIRRLTNYRY